MKQHLIIIAVSIICITFFVTYANKEVMATKLLPLTCDGQNTNTTLSVSLNGQNINIDEIDAIINGKMNTIKDLAKTVGVDSFTLKYKNYSVNAYHSGAMIQYSYNMSMNFSFTPAEKGVDLVKLFSKEGYNTSLSVNTNYPGSGC